MTYNGYKGLCNACIFASDISIYLTNSPYCLVEFDGQTYNVGEMFERHLCFYDDPRFYDVECYSRIANNTFDCTKICDANARGEHAVLEEGQSYQLAADSRCIYKYDWKNSTTIKKLVAPRRMLGDFSSGLKDEFVFEDDRRRL